MTCLRRAIGPISVAFVVVAGACTGANATRDYGDAGRDGGVDTPSNFDFPDATDRATTAPCPASAPVDKGPCSLDNVGCEYGGVGDHRLCSTLAYCQSNRWFVFPPATSCVSSTSQNPPSCPASFTTLSTGAACPSESPSTCVYPEGVCRCVPCAADGGWSTKWACGAWQQPAGCAPSRPAVGSACSNPNQTCFYGDGCLDGQPEVMCRNGRWEEGEDGACLFSCDH